MRTNDATSPGPQSLMPLETPLLRVSRPVAACQRCKSAKIKCDGKLPACTACERSNRAAQCSSPNDQFARGRERSYVATLESRVEKMERKIQEAKARRHSSIAMTDAPSIISSTTRRTSVDSTATGRPRDRRARIRQELSDIDELVSDFGFLTVNATARDYYGFTSSVSYARLILAASAKEPLPSGMKKELPTRSQASPLVRHYVDSFLSVLPVFGETSLYSAMDAVYSSDSLKMTQMDYWTLRMVLAIASVAKSQQRGDTPYSDAVGHICEALSVAESVLHPGSIWSIQAMVLLVQYSILDPAHFDSWTLIGAASRAMVDLGMHQEPSKSLNTPKDKLELRRRVYYCVYSLDRSTSLVQTRAFSFSDDSANVTLPYFLKPTSPSVTSPGPKAWNNSSDPALGMVRLRTMQSKWYTELFQSGRAPDQDIYNYIWDAYREMTDWFNQLPPNIPTGIKEFFELELLYSYVYILSPSPKCPNPSEDAQKLILAHCSTYAAKIRQLTSDSQVGKKVYPFSFYDALRAYMTGRQFVDLLLRNLEILFVNSYSSYASPSLDEQVDPLAPSNASMSSPPLPTPPSLYSTPTNGDLVSPPSGGAVKDSITRALDTVSDFVAVLSYFSVRFGHMGGLSWRDRFQMDSQPLVDQLSRIRQQHQSPHRSHSDASGSGFPLWRSSHPPHSGPVTPQNNPSPSPRPSISFYPSPATTQYTSHSSPGYMPQQDVDANPLGAGWVGMGAGQAHHGPPPGSNGSGTAHAGASREANPYQMGLAALPEFNHGSAVGTSGGGVPPPPGSVDELGIGSMAAWETLPGGNLNHRFSLTPR